MELAKLASAPQAGMSFKEFWACLPEILAAQDLKNVVEAIAQARAQERPVVLGMGAHPIKVGLSPVIIELMRRGIITALATNGAAIVHDFELSYAGCTSEDVAQELCTGRFGMAKETGSFLNRAIKNGARKNLGLGESIGKHIAESRFPNKDKSLFAECYRLGLPATVHVSIGADIIHMNPEADGAAIGATSMRDFRLFASVLAGLEGGVYINLGSAVVLPEVFLKALNLARNLGSKVEHITTVNMDFLQHYRPTVNVLKRPTMTGGKFFALTGHHEIMFPLLAAGILEEISK